MILTPDILLQAYRSGVFPMAERRDDPELFWVEPRNRGIIPIGGLHISRSLAKQLRRGEFKVTRNHAFSQVMEACADRDETWINDEIFALFHDLNQRGCAHSIEVWMDEDLAGGVYGLEIGGAFCAESMFSRKTGGSKIALAYLMDVLERAGFTLFDTQFLTEHLASLGCIEISRDTYLARLQHALCARPQFAKTPLAASGYDVVQRNTQTS